MNKPNSDGAGRDKEMIEEQLKSTFVRLLQDLQDDQFADASEREVACIELADGRQAKVVLKIDTDEDSWT